MNDKSETYSQQQLEGPLKDTLHLYETPIGHIQYGCPQLADKLALNQINEIPQYYIVPLNCFNKQNSQFLGEFEIPLQYNMKQKNLKTTLICTEDQYDAISSYLQECIIGGDIDPKLFPKEFHSSFDQSGSPQFKSEAALIQKYINQSVPIESIDQLVEFKIFNGVDQIVELDKTCYLKMVEQNIIQIYNNRTLAHTLNCKQIEDTIYKATDTFLDEFYSQLQDKYEDFQVPEFGVTGLFSPYNPQRQTGFFFWVNKRIVLVDPPIHINRYLKAIQIPSQLIDWVILTHCHTQNDIGVMQRFMNSQRMEIITTPQIINQFIRKYSKISDINSEIMRRLFKFKPVVIGAGINLNGCIIRFHYSFHQIPCIGFEITNQNKSIYYSGDTYYDPKFYLQLQKSRQITQKRYEFLSNIKFIHNIILFDGGNDFASTDIKILQKLPEDVKKNIYLTNLSQKNLSEIEKYNNNINPFELHSTTQIKSSQIMNTQQSSNGTVNVFQCGLSSKLSLDIKRHKVMDYISKLEILSSIDVFEGLTIKNIRDLMDISNEEQFSQGQIVIIQNTKGSKWYIILKGKIKIKNQYFEGHFQDGEYFGETALAEDNSGLRMADCIAETDVTLLTLEKQDFWFAFGQGSESMGRKILEKQARLVQSRQKQGINDLRNNQFFRQYLSSNQMTQLQMISKFKTVKKDEFIWKFKDKSLFSLLIKQGSVQLIQQENSNNQNPNNSQDDFEYSEPLKEGSFIGDLNALIEDAHHTTSLLALEDVMYWKIERADLLSFLRRNPGLFLAFGDSQYFN